MMNLWIDDLRTPPAGYAWVKTSQEAIEYLEVNNPDHISFDHDLGGDDTSRQVILWLCEKNDKWPRTAQVFIP